MCAWQVFYFCNFSFYNPYSLVQTQKEEVQLHNG